MKNTIKTYILILLGYEVSEIMVQRDESLRKNEKLKNQLERHKNHAQNSLQRGEQMERKMEKQEAEIEENRQEQGELIERVKQLTRELDFEVLNKVMKPELFYFTNTSFN